MRRFPLIRDEGLVNIERLFIHDERLAPFLILNRRGVCGLDSDEKSSLEVENSVDVEEDLVQDVASNIAFVFQTPLQIVKILEVLHILPLGINQLFHDVVTVTHGTSNSWNKTFILGIWLHLHKKATLFGQVKNVVNNLGNLQEVNFD
jgi:hypothetical protein